MRTLSFIIVLFTASLFAQTDEPCLLDSDPPKHLVLDMAEILTPEQEQQLEAELINFSRETSNQILVVTVNDLCGHDKAEFTYTLGERWKVGQKEFDNGVVIMIKPHGKAGDRHVFIAVGYGLEGAIPDATSRRIIETEMIPHFRQEDFAGGIANGLRTIEGLARGEINADNYGKTRERVPVLPFLLVLVIVFLVFFRTVRKMQQSALGKNMSFWAALWLLSQMGHKRAGGWNNFHSGSGSFGGGGFGGFGGGSFGGGGAGGSW